MLGATRWSSVGVVSQQVFICSLWFLRARPGLGGNSPSGDRHVLASGSGPFVLAVVPGPAYCAMFHDEVVCNGHGRKQ